MINGFLSLICAIFSVMLIVVLQLSPQWRRIPFAKTAFLIMTFIFITLLADGVAVMFLTDWSCIQFLRASGQYLVQRD